MEEHYHALTYLASVLAAAFVGGAVFKKLKQPVMIGYIIVGLVLGPSVFGLVGSREEVSLLAELGILLLLFVAGMELDLNNFKSVSKISLITCGAQIILGLAVMFILGWLFGWPLNRSVLMGFAVALSSTAVALKILEDMNLKETTIGHSSLGILIAQDLAVIPMILIIGAMNTAEGFNYWGMARLVIAVVLMGGLMYVLTRKPRAFLRLWARFERIKGEAMQGQAAITALAFCFTASAVAGFFGLSAAYGAFLAGIVLGHTMNRHELEEHTRPIFDVMIMVFFLSIGLLIDLQFLWDHLLAALTVLFLTMCLKTIANVAILRWQGMDKSEAYMTGAVLAQVGEFSFILAAMGLGAGTIDNDSYKYVVAVITLSLLFTPLWLYLVKRNENLPQLELALLADQIKKLTFNGHNGDVRRRGNKDQNEPPASDNTPD
ncbi:cation:proton antiporter [Emcibacter nanhaiensis]|uniref:Cation:proton antiporter n=1 Tax=Emcibacter nanhaiensis TaxID=1505037 RepID=A0A501PNE2_9PROT|nr:cation:proton antiporter [Emcibacter nanhaiensis]TPD61953.1 cation:proton antiporter [Emcibacter nanhaiensis]